METKTINERFNHLVKVISSERFLNNKILCNDVPFFIANYPIKEEQEMSKVGNQLINKLRGDFGIEIVKINIYDLAVEILKSNKDDWNWYIENESTTSKQVLSSELQSILSAKDVLVPAILKKIEENKDEKVIFITGVGAVYPYIRTHNILVNLEKFVREKPLVLFYPGEYQVVENYGTTYSLFGVIQEERDYRARNIFEISL